MGNAYDQEQKKGYRIINIEEGSPASRTSTLRAKQIWKC